MLNLINSRSVLLVIASSLFMTLFANLTMFSKAISWMHDSNTHQLHLLTLGFYQFFLLTFLIAIFTVHRWHRIVICLFLLLASISAYFADSYGVIIDRSMLINALETNLAEASDLASWRFFFYMLFLFVIPSIIIFRVRVVDQSYVKKFLSHGFLALLSVLGVAVVFFSTSAFSSSFFREQKHIRVYSNPLSTLYASYQVVNKDILKTVDKFKVYGEDAVINRSTNDRKLIIMIVGETARADRFSLNGYSRNTNPLLSKENLISFTNVSSCGTSTAVSVPCMFSFEGREKFDLTKFKSRENVLDVVAKTGVSVLWRDNNSSSKGVADRLAYEDFLSSKNNPVCDPECRDIGMLKGLDDYITKHKNRDILIVLHQMGSHGPAYYKRVPDRFQKFEPICKTNQLDKCTKEEIGNAYDNTILYTDYFLSEVIQFLKKYDQKFLTAMFYVSDHGESLGEYGVYLHGMPYAVAPKGVTNVPMILWFGDKWIKSQNIDMNLLKKQSNSLLSHDDVPHTILGLLDIDTVLLNKEKNIQNLGIKR